MVIARAVESGNGMSSTIQAKRLGPEDAELAFEAIGAIKDPESHAGFSAAYLRRFLSRSENVLIVAWNEGGPAGFLLAYVLDRVDRDQQLVCLYESCASEFHRRGGVGRALVEAGERWGRSQGCTEFASDAEPENDVSAAAHTSCGFVDVGMVRCFRKGL